MHHRLTPRAMRRTATAAVVAALFCAPALAFEIDVGNPDIEMRWDNTLRYNLGGRAQKQNPAILLAPNNDDGDRNFSNGSLVTNRLDILSEFDFVWQKSYGARVSAALWYDNAYGSLDNTFAATANTLVNGLPAPGVLSPYSKRYLKGPSGEWLDAFGFANWEMLGMQWNVKAGQHTVFWGDSLLLGGAVHGVSYAQNSLDLMKGFGTPGAGRPLTSVLAVAANVLSRLPYALSYQSAALTRAPKLFCQTTSNSDRMSSRLVTSEPLLKLRSPSSKFGLPRILASCDCARTPRL